MEIRNKTTYAPDYAIHPGEYLEEVLEARSLKKRELAERLGISVKHLSQIINKQASMSAAMAVQLEMILGVSANIWNNLNADYELFEERQKNENALAEQKAWLKTFPLRDLKKLGLLPETKDTSILIASLLRLFEIPDPAQWNSYFGKMAVVNFRKSTAFDDNLPHLMSWLRAGEIAATGIATRPFTKEGFKSALEELRKLTIAPSDSYEEKLKRLCAEAGVAIAFIPEFDKTHISGATRWLTQDKALIIISLRYKTNDQFWFTFFHEAGHLLLHGKKDIYIDDHSGFVSNEETEANRFARNMLIPEGNWKKFVACGEFSPVAIQNFARARGIHPGIIVGRLQHEKILHFSQYNELKEKLEFVEMV